MRHECECDHNARNIHFQDTVKIFGNPEAEAGSDERQKYEKYKDIERNVQNAIELVAGKIDESQESIQKLMDDIVEQLERYYALAPDLSKYTQVNVNGHGISYPMIFIINQQTYDNLTNEDKLDSRKIYFIADVDSSTDPMVNSEIIFQRSIFITGSAREISYKDNTTAGMGIILHPIRKSGPIFSEYDFQILDRLYKERGVSDSAQTAAQKVKEDYNDPTDIRLIDNWTPYLDSLTRFDMELFAKYLETLGGNTTYTNDEDAAAVWEEFLRTYDPLGYWQTWDFNKTGVINAGDAQTVLVAAAAIGTGGDPTGMLDWKYQISRQSTIDKAAWNGIINASLAAKILQYAAAVGTGTLGNGDTFDKLKIFVSRYYGK